MATKKTVFLSTRTVEWINTTTKQIPRDSVAHWSEGINASIDQLLFLLSESLPELTIEEWTTILNVYTGCYFPAHGIPAHIASDMMDNVGQVSLDFLEPDYRALVEKVYMMSQVEQMAILYFVQIFWNQDFLCATWEETIQAIKDRF